MIKKKKNIYLKDSSNNKSKLKFYSDINHASFKFPAFEGQNLLPI